MEARIQNPAMLVPGAMKAMIAFSETAKQSGVPAETLQLVHLRVSQVNGCSLCVNLDFMEAAHHGGVTDKLFAVSAWREAPWFDDAERAALALAECVTRLADRPDAVPDDVWAEAARHYDEAQLASLLVQIAAVNVWNRLNVSTRQPAGPISW